MRIDADDLIARLGEVVGPQHVLTSSADMAASLRDWRGRYQGSALCVVRPKSAGEVAGIVRLCAEARAPIVPQSGNTGLCGGATPVDPASVVVNVSRMTAIREVDVFNSTMTVDAGCVLETVRAVADENGLLFPMLLGSVGSCEVGGLVSTNAGGTGVLRYGNMRELVLGLEVVLPDGRIWNGLRALRKNNAGYDLKQLFIGAEGTLGIVTGAVLKLFPKLSASVTAMVTLNSVADAIALLRLLRRRLGTRIEAFEVMSSLQLDIVLKHMTALRRPLAGSAPWYAMLEIADTANHDELSSAVQDALQDALSEGFVTDATIAADTAKAENIWQIRHTISESNKLEGFTVSNDTAVPISRLPDFIDKVTRRAQEAFPQAHVCHCGHIGDGNIHVIVVLPRSMFAGPDDAEAAATAVNAIVHDESAAQGGSISAEHGIGQMHVDRLPKYLDAVDLDLMRTVKTALDPGWIMNPGKVIRPRQG